MNTIKNIILILLAILLLPLAVFAQRAGDTFGATRVLNIMAPTAFTVTNAGAAGSITNKWMDVRLFDGIGSLIVNVATNSGASTGGVTLTIQQSVDQTNILSPSTYALGTAYNISSTNNYYGTNSSGVGSVQATDPWIIPGTFVTPTASTAGFAEPYWSEAPFTNSSSFNISAAGTYLIGIDWEDAQRYLNTALVFTNGTTTNYSISIQGVGFPKYMRMQ